MRQHHGTDCAFQRAIHNIRLLTLACHVDDAAYIARTSGAVVNGAAPRMKHTTLAPLQLSVLVLRQEKLKQHRPPYATNHSADPSALTTSTTAKSGKHAPDIEYDQSLCSTQNHQRLNA